MEAPLGGVGWVSSDRAPSSPSGFDYIMPHRRELPGLRPCKIMHTAGLHTMGTFHTLLGCLPLKLSCQPKEGKPVCNSSREND